MLWSKSTVYFINHNLFKPFGQWLWFSWQRGRLQNQRSMVQIQSSENILMDTITVKFWKDENKINKNRPGMAHLKTLFLLLYALKRLKYSKC